MTYSRIQNLWRPGLSYFEFPRYLLFTWTILVLTLPACTPKKTQELLEAPQSLGVVLAEEAARVAGTKKQIAIISPGNWGPPSTAEESFKDTLKKLGFSAVAAKAANVG